VNLKPAIELAKGLQGVDVVVADHTEQLVNATIGSVLVVENKSKGRTYSRITIKVENGKVASKEAKTIDPIGLYTGLLTCDAGTIDAGQCKCPEVACPSDGTYSCNSGKCQRYPNVDTAAFEKAAADLIAPYKTALAAKFDEKIGTTTNEFPRDGSIERKQETALGDLIAEALLDRYKAAPDGAQIAFTNGGGIRDSLPAKNYTPLAAGLDRTLPDADVIVGDVYSVLRFNNAAVVRKVKGKVLWQALEHSVAAAPATNGRFLQIAGFKFTYTTSVAADLNDPKRVQSVTLIDGNKVIPKNDETEYVAVTNDFTNSGGDGYTMLVDPNPAPSRELMNLILYEYIKKKGTLTAATDGRILAQ
jgi:5'-nucleotidase